MASRPSSGCSLRAEIAKLTQRLYQVNLGICSACSFLNFFIPLPIPPCPFLSPCSNHIFFQKEKEAQAAALHYTIRSRTRASGDTAAWGTRVTGEQGAHTRANGNRGAGARKRERTATWAQGRERGYVLGLLLQKATRAQGRERESEREPTPLTGK